ncbi:hypothetical protein [Frigoriglobus tundricola]|uniref:hypothetical protein n=1 Tax=Frigoriglobus tundricola TaxID=2774151 RepID=UPI00148ECE28|nr:hypothetical protein [Frigoriglobus tundricola]
MRPATTVLSSAPDQLVRDYESAPGDLVACGPPDGPGGGDLQDLLPTAPALDTIARSWRAACSVPLAGSPLAAALPTNFHALDAAAQAFFDHLADLAPEWPAESEECGYVWLVAGVLIASGGRQVVRRAGPGPRCPPSACRPRRRGDGG